MSPDEKKQFYIDLFDFSKPAKHGVIVTAPNGADINVMSTGGIEERAQMAKKVFETEKRHAEEIGDDRIPMASVWTGTEIFASAFGSPVHKPENGAPFALPAVYNAEQAENLREPDISFGTLGDILRLSDRITALCGQEYPLRICDVQSPFDISALIWEKKDFFMALVETPDSAHKLLQKVTNTLVRFIDEFKRRYDNACIVHYPQLWLPVDKGICLSEDDIGSISPELFVEFCLPYLTQLSEHFGGISMHSCASSQRQWDNFLKLPGLGYLNLHHPPTLFDVSVEKFAGKAVLVPGAKNDAEFLKEAVRIARPGTRYLFISSAENAAEAKARTEEFKSILGRR